MIRRPPRWRAGADGALWPGLLALALIGSLAVAACSGGDGASSDADAAATAQASAESGDETPPQIVRERSVVFVHADDDEIHILDGTDGTLIRALARGEGGFLRGALRPLERERRRFDADPTAPYRLVLEAGGRLVLVDPHSDLELDVDAFGRSSRAEFMTLFSTD